MDDQKGLTTLCKHFPNKIFFYLLWRPKILFLPTQGIFCQTLYPLIEGTKKKWRNMI